MFYIYISFKDIFHDFKFIDKFYLSFQDNTARIWHFEIKMWVS